MKPLLLLDVDGPLNVYGIQVRDADLPEGAILRNGSVLFPTRHSAHLAQLAEHFEIHWCTMWEDRANTELSAMFGLAPDTPVVPLTHTVDWELASFKAPAIATYVKDRSFAWIDDDAFEDAYILFDSLDLDYIIAHVDPRVGLTDDHVASLCAWAHPLVKPTKLPPS